MYVGWGLEMDCRCRSCASRETDRVGPDLGRYKARCKSMLGLAVGRCVDLTRGSNGKEMRIDLNEMGLRSWTKSKTKTMEAVSMTAEPRSREPAMRCLSVQPQGKESRVYIPFK